MCAGVNWLFDHSSMHPEHPNAKKDEMIRFSFLDTENGYIEMVMDAPQKYSNKGWKIIPHKEPLIVSL